LDPIERRVGISRIRGCIYYSNTIIRHYVRHNSSLRGAFSSFQGVATRRESSYLNAPLNTGVHLRE